MFPDPSPFAYLQLEGDWPNAKDLNLAPLCRTSTQTTEYHDGCQATDESDRFEVIARESAPLEGRRAVTRHPHQWKVRGLGLQCRTLAKVAHDFQSTDTFSARSSMSSEERNLQLRNVEAPVTIKRKKHLAELIGNWRVGSADSEGIVR